MQHSFIIKFPLIKPSSFSSQAWLISITMNMGFHINMAYFSLDNKAVQVGAWHSLIGSKSL